MSDKLPRVLRPHERRSQQARLETSEDEPFGHITPPSLELLEALEAKFPVELPSTTLPDAETLAWVRMMQGQQQVLNFIRQLNENQGA